MSSNIENNNNNNNNKKKKNKKKKKKNNNNNNVPGAKTSIFLTRLFFLKSF